MTAARRWIDHQAPDGLEPSVAGALVEQVRPVPGGPSGRGAERQVRADLAGAVLSEQARFLAEAAHELRGGAGRLSLMAAAIAELSEAASDPSLSPRLRGLAAEGRRLQELATRLLDLVQLTESGRPLDVEPVRLAAALDLIARGEATPAGTVEIRVAPDLAVLADPVALDQVLTNLVRNGLRHGGGRVVVEASPRGSSGRVSVVVSDEGPGVPAERQADLFVPYARGVGHGLGLSIAAQLTRLIGGDLTYRDNEPRGARFVLRLRRALI
jgi:signal transduction histidine kinase